MTQLSTSVTKESNIIATSYTVTDKAQKLLSMADKKFSSFETNSNPFSQKGFTIFDGNIFVAVFQEPFTYIEKKDMKEEMEDFLSSMTKKYGAKVLLNHRKKDGQINLVIYISPEKAGEMFVREVL